MKFRKVDRDSKLFLKVHSVFEKMSVMLKDFEQVDPSRLSNAIGFRNGAESLGLGVKVCDCRRVVR
jgi:hypothetical protein